VAPVVPDVVTLTNGLGGGMPIGATVALGAAGSLIEPGNHGSTFGGNPIACAAALAVLDTVEREGLLDEVALRGKQLTEALVAEQAVSAVEGRGLLLGAQLVDDRAAAVVARAQDAGFLLNNTGPDRLRFAPPLTVTEADISSLAQAWPQVLSGEEATG
jgi:acetylornithine/N-succinyldiaminopimelate aminotransferase